MVALALVICADVGALRLVEEAQFGEEELDLDRWEVVTTDEDEWVRLEDGTLRCHSTGNGYAFVRSKTSFLGQNFTFLVDFKINVLHGRSLDIRFNANDSRGWPRWLAFGYDADTWGWTPSYYRDGEWDGDDYSYDTDAVTGVWYIANITVRYDVATMSVVERDTGRNLHTVTIEGIDPLPGKNRVHIGVYQFHDQWNSDTQFDDYRMYSYDPPVNKPPEWLPMPVFNAVEDEPLTIDFTPYVVDPDGGPEPLWVECQSPHVVEVEGMSITFLFSDDLTRANLFPMATDGQARVAGHVMLEIEPANDPPTVRILAPANRSLHEVGSTVGFHLDVTDPDLPVGGELLVWMESRLTGPVWSGAGLGDLHYELSNLSLGHHRLTAFASDGELEASDWIDVYIYEPPPENLPPVWSVEGPFQALEDVPVTVDLAGNVTDPDGRPLPLIVECSSEHLVSIDGLNVTCLFGEGVLSAEVDVVADDGLARVATTIRFVVEPVNDPPTVEFLSPENGSLFMEGDTVGLRLSAKDIDLPLGEDLAISISSNVSGIIWTATGRGEIAFDWDVLAPGHHLVTVTASDGELVATDTLEIEVMPVPPELPGFKLTAGCAVGIIIVAIVTVVVTYQQWRGLRRPDDIH